MRFLTLIILSLSTLALSTFESPSFTLNASFSPSRKALNISTPPKTNCTTSIFAATNSTKVQQLTTSKLNPLFQFSGDSTKRQIAVRSISALRGNTNLKKIFLQARTDCNAEQSVSQVTSLNITSNSRGLSFSNWLKDTSKKSLQNIKLKEVFPGLSFDKPVDFRDSRDGTERFFVVEQSGKIQVIQNNSTKSTFLDLSAKVANGSEQGLLGLALHPGFSTNKKFFVNYTKKSDGATIVSQFTVSADNQNVADSTSEIIILEIAQPFENHNGGQIQFGPDGYLYIAMGDGGSGGDPQGHGQNRATLLGDILRIDVDETCGFLNYCIPLDNPYKGNNSGFKEEIYASGFRNPWRFSFDFARLWAADVGQGDYEEVDLVKKGLNYGWNTMEGNHCYPIGNNSCSKAGLELPIGEYSHKIGQSITGGYVYRGSEIPALYGSYIYADFAQGLIFALNIDSAQKSPAMLKDTELLISSFGRDKNGEVYLLSYGEGKVYKFAY